MLSPLWNNGAGAATWGNGANGTVGTISTTASVIDCSSNDGNPCSVSVLPNGNYIVVEQPPSFIATWVDGTTGSTLDGQNVPDAQNSLCGGGVGPGVVPLGSGSEFLYSGADAVTVAFTDPNELTYATDSGRTINISPSFITRTLDSGRSVTLQADDDITISSPIDVTAAGAGGDLTLQAGRSIFVNADIDTSGGNLSLIANDSLADGVIDGDRDPGNATIAAASRASLNAGGGALSIDVKNSTGKTNDGASPATLLDVAAASTMLSSATALGISIGGTSPGDGVAAGTYTQVNVTGPIDLNGASLSIVHNAATAGGSTFTILQATGGIGGTFNGLGEGDTVTASDGTTFVISYQGDGGRAVVLTQAVPTQPAITVQPANQTATAGQEATFTATASGVPTPAVQWEVSTDGGTTFGNVPGATSTTLTITTSASQNNNQYRAVFTNQAGQAITQAATLSVNGPPQVTLQPNAQTVGAGKSVTFTAAASGTPAPTLQWQVLLPGTSAFINLKGATSSTLTFKTNNSENGTDIAPYSPTWRARS